MEKVVKVKVKRPTEEPVDIDTDNSEKIEKFKGKIADKLGIPERELRLINNEVELKDGKKTVGESAFTGTPILAIQNGMKVQFKTLTRKLYELILQKDEKVGCVKERLRVLIHVAVKEQILILNSKKMSDGTTLESNGVKEGSVVFIVLQLQG